MKETVYEIGKRRELMMDHCLTDFCSDNILLTRHQPIAKELIPDLKNSSYGTILKMDGIYRFYYRGVVEGYDGPGNDGNPGEYTGVMESRDAVHWKKPVLDLYPQAAPNAIWFGSDETHNFVPFIDNSPGCPETEKYKAIGGLCKSGGVKRFYSADGIHWTRYDYPGVYDSMPGSHKTLDSHNVCFWSESEQCYVIYFRYYITGSKGQPLRTIARGVSKDFINWSDPVELKINRQDEHLYVSLFAPYFRAPHFYIATPTRYFEERQSVTDITMCHTRDGKTILRPFPDAWITPGRDPERWGNRSNYMTYNYLQTSPDEISYYHKSGIRYALRLDGFASLHAGVESGRWISKPMRYSGGTLECNIATSGAGLLRAGIMKEDGSFIEGFSTEDCDEFFGDEIAMKPTWKGSSILPLKEGDVFKLCFELKECDLFSFAFQ